MPRPLEDRIGELASRQHGVVTRAQLLELGLQPGSICRRIRAGRLRALHRGVYLIGPITPPHALDMAAVLACGPRALLGFRSAAGLWAFADASAATDVDVVVPHRAGRQRTGVHIHRAVHLDDADRAVRDGIPVTSAIRTLLDFASVASAHELEHAVAVAERERRVRLEELQERVRRSGRRPGHARLRALLAGSEGPALTRSEAERRFLTLVRSARLPAPATNAVFDGYEIDFLWPAERIAVEVDGHRHHATRFRFERDRQRAACLAAHGIQVIPITWRMIVDDGTATAVRIAQALLHAKLRSRDAAGGANRADIHPAATRR